MRNIVEYPITAEEAISAIQIAHERHVKDYREYIGSIDGIALLMAEKFIASKKKEFDTFSQASLEIIFEDKE